MEMNLIYKRAWAFSKATGVDFEDLVSEGVEAYLRAERTFNPSKGASLTTWAYIQVTGALQGYCARELHHVHSSDEELEWIGVQDPVPLWEALADLPEDVRTVCSIILKDPVGYGPLLPTAAWREVKAELTAMGWSAVAAHAALQHAKAYFRQATA